ncbi:hypothetical protein AX15_007907, partial [Amanita polypyramis BW_CC]
MLTPNIAPISTAQTVTARTRPPVLAALGSSPGQTPLKLNGSTKPKEMQPLPNAARVRLTIQDLKDPCLSTLGLTTPAPPQDHPQAPMSDTISVMTLNAHHNWTLLESQLALNEHQVYLIQE